jgi:Flp pilus assembly pilin Flp
MKSFFPRSGHSKRNQPTIVHDRRGVTMIEYAMIAALVAVALTVSLTSLKTAISKEIASIASVL